MEHYCQNILAEKIGAFTVGITNIPASMASALLADVNSLAGLNTMKIATPRLLININHI